MGEFKTPIMKLELGEVYPGFQKGFPEGVLFDFGNSGGILIIAYNRITHREIIQIKNGHIKLGIVTVDGISFILSKFGNLAWMDSPYHSSLSQPFEIKPIQDDSTGYALSIVAIDNITGIIRALRFVSMPSQLSRYLYGIIEAQRNYQKQNPFDREDYNHSVTKIYTEYSTDRLVKYADVFDLEKVRDL